MLKTGYLWIVIQVRGFVRLYREIINEHHQPYRRTNHALFHLKCSVELARYRVSRGKDWYLWIVVQVRDRAWLVRLYGKIIPELKLVQAHKLLSISLVP